MKRICVYCGSSPGRHPEFTESARALGRALVQRNIGLVYGGASIGVMGAVADAVVENGGEVIGVMPQALIDKEVSHSGLSELRVVDSMHERKALMAELSDGFIALPGGFGTLEELFEVLTWSQLGFHRKPCGLLDIRDYYSHLTAFLDHATDQGFIGPIYRNILLVEKDSSLLLDSMASYSPPIGSKWTDRKN